jgi:hypothetical protein
LTVPASALTDLPPQDYDAIRRLVRTGDLALCHGTQAFSRMISWGTGAPWSHIALIVRLDEIGRVVVFEAVEKIGVRMVPLKRFVSEDSGHHKPYPGDIVICRHDEFAGKISPERLEKLTAFATDRLGAPFEAGEMVKIAARIALGWFGVRLPRMLETDDEYICSEYVGRCYEAVGIKVPWDGRGFLAPSDFAADPKLKAIARVARHPFGGEDTPEDQKARDADG